jgi:hypothetical protein
MDSLCITPWLYVTIEKDKQVTQTREQLREVYMEQPYAMITVELGQTVNIGNYNSVKFHVSLSYPTKCDTKKQLEESYTKVYNWVSEKVGLLVDEVDSTHSIS